MKMFLKIKKWIYMVFAVFRRLAPYTSYDESSMNVMQVLLSSNWREQARTRNHLLPLRDIGFRVYSESNEDGILLAIFSLIGATNKIVIDIGAAGLDGFVKGSNAANLIINHRWTGLLVDGNKQALDLARTFYANLPATSIFPPSIVNAYVTADNIDAIIAEHGFAGEVDLLCIDIDGIDYWIWNAISCIRPRVVVIEYRDALGPDLALTVPYRPDFYRQSHPEVEYRDHYYGASLAAFVSLAQQNGYRLVGCNDYCFNAFFVCTGVGEELLPEVPISSCFEHRRAKSSIQQFFPVLEKMPWEKVECHAV